MHYVSTAPIHMGGHPENGWTVKGTGICDIKPMLGLEAVWLTFRGAELAKQFRVSR